MKDYRINSLMAGVLFLLGTFFGITSAVVGGKAISSIISADPLSGSELMELITSDSSNLLAGSFLILMMGISLVAMTVFLYPIFRKDSEELAMGMLLFRGAMEGTWYFVTTISFIALYALGVEYATSGTNSEVLESIGSVIYKFHEILGPVGTVLFLIGASCLYVSFYRTKLIPRWLTIWGLIGVAPYMTYALLRFFELDNGIGFYLQMPLAIQEMVMAIWLIVKGFNQIELNKLLTDGESL